MRIAFFTETYMPQINGVTYTIQNWKQELEGRGHDVQVVYPESSHEPGPGEHPVTGIDIGVVDGYRLGAGFPGDIADRIGAPDIVHGHGPFSLGVLGQRVAKRHDAPFVATHHTPLYRYFDYLSGTPEMHAVFYTLYRAWERLFYRSCDAALAPSRYTATRLQERILREVTPISNGLDTDFFTPSRPSFREELGLEVERVVGFCGRLGYEKNLEDLLALAERFDGHLLVAGDGFARERYEPMFREQENATFLGRLDREEMPAFYSSLDLFLLPSTVETQGIAVMEANACGTPAVAADAMALTETIEDGRNGYLYPPGDIDGLEQAVEAAYDDIDVLAAGAREYAVEHSLETVVDRLLAFYRDLG